jgi:bifunctional DNase/RNase
VVRLLGAEVVDVQVHGVREGTYLGRVRLRVGGDMAVREVDSRPSDAVALALRVQAPIRVRRALLRDARDTEVGPPHEPEPITET